MPRPAAARARSPPATPRRPGPAAAPAPAGAGAALETHGTPSKRHSPFAWIFWRTSAGMIAYATTTLEHGPPTMFEVMSLFSGSLFQGKSNEKTEETMLEAAHETLSDLNSLQPNRLPVQRRD